MSICPPRRAALALAPLLATLAMHAPAAAADGLAKVPDALDPQSWVLPQDMSWSDYRPIPGFNWADGSHQPPKVLRAALILGDHSDREFLVTRPQGSDVAGNPTGTGGVPRAGVGDFYKGLLNTPQALNHGHTINEYWMEDSYGAIGIDMDAFGPYRMDRPEYQYGLAEYGQDSMCPNGETCDGDFDTELLGKSLADVEAGQVTHGGRDYDFRFLLHSGYDESGVWQELGEMRFPNKESVTEPFGNPDPSKPNWAPTRYVPWTSFYAARGIWSHAIPGVQATEGENDGTSVYEHEFSHILGVLDNYNNSYADPPQREYTGPWDMMSRGSFNGPGGNHNRYEVPATLGATMGSQHMLRDKLRMGFLKPGEVRTIDRNALAATGPVFEDVWAREIPLGQGTGRAGLHGLLLTLSGGDNTPACTVEEDWRCDGGDYENYTLEVVDRMGTDSFTPDHGVLIAKNKTPEVAPWKWVADAHPEDIDKVDFRRADGTIAKVTKGDYRQLADALFHAGTGPGVVSEYVDEPNRLHFYVLGSQRDAQGVLSYRVAVRSLDGGGPAARAVAATAADSDPAPPGRVAVHNFRVTNNGDAEDLVRVKASTTDGWTTSLRANVLDVPAGATVTVPVYVTVPDGEAGRRSTTLEVTASAETDPSASVSRTATIVPLPAPVGSVAATAGSVTATAGTVAAPAASTKPGRRRASLRLAAVGRSCVRNGKLSVRLLSSLPLLRAQVSAPRHLLRKLRGRALSHPLRFRNLRGRRVTITASARAKDGRLLRARRTFRTCPRST
jgi:M6 family metalloprotease-like protein